MRGNALGTLVFLCMVMLGFSCQTAEDSTGQLQTTQATAAKPSDTGLSVEPAIAQQPQTAQTAPPQPSGMTQNTELTNKAWDAFNKGDYDSAIGLADKCINEFLGRAMREQEDLEAKKSPLPPTGPVPDQEKQAIFARGLLNDVATCMYIKGRSLEAKGRKEEAAKVYKATAKFTYARCWDPKGGAFWSPAEGALDRLRTLG
jgi:hypothetical protein